MQKVYYIEQPGTGKVWSADGYWTLDKNDAALFTCYDNAVQLADQKDALLLELPLGQRRP